VPAAVEQALAFPGLSVLIIYGEDAYGGAPDIADCDAIVAAHSSTEVRVNPGQILLDPHWQTVTDRLNRYGSNWLPWNAVLRPRDMLYVFGDGSNTPGDHQEAIAELLASDW
jgi:hypothetical protein